jgi:hypothetical protein
MEQASMRPSGKYVENLAQPPLDPGGPFPYLMPRAKIPGIWPSATTSSSIAESSRQLSWQIEVCVL